MSLWPPPGSEYIDRDDLAAINWRRIVFWIVRVVAFVPLFVMFVCGFLAEGLQLQIERLDEWSREVR